MQQCGRRTSSCLFYARSKDDERKSWPKLRGYFGQMVFSTGTPRNMKTALQLQTFASALTTLLPACLHRGGAEISEGADSDVPCCPLESAYTCMHALSWSKLRMNYRGRVIWLGCNVSQMQKLVHPRLVFSAATAMISINLEF